MATSHDTDMVIGQPMDWSKRFPKLHGLFANHLSQSWTSFHETAADALQEGFDDRTLEDLRTAAIELHDLLAMGLNDDQLDDVLYYGLGSGYQVSGQTHEEWLNEVAAQLGEAVNVRASDGTPGSPDRTA
jgi:hypothetical protein